MLEGKERVGEPEPQPLPEAAARELLRRYGLDGILTELDAPALWIAALERHWPDPSSPDLNPAELRFGIGRLPPGGLEAAGASTRSGMEKVEEWCFERAGNQRLRAVPCQDRPQVGFMGAMFMASAGDSATLSNPQIYLGRVYLDVSRPSRGMDRALVHAGISALGNVGSGETRVWAADASGQWEDTGVVVARWLT